MKKNVSELLVYHDLIASIVAAMEARDTYTADHSMRVAEMTVAICNYLGLPDEDCTLYHIAAHLHDLGKIGIPDTILRKESALNDEEWLAMKEHPAIGYHILHKIDSFEEISKIVRAHHERWDGNGYPDELKNQQIPFGSRIIAIADSIDAMMSARPYRKGMSSQKCQNEILSNCGKMYDAQIVKAVTGNWDDLLQKRTALCPLKEENDYV